MNSKGTLFGPKPGMRKTTLKRALKLLNKNFGLLTVKKFYFNKKYFIKLIKRKCYYCKTKALNYFKKENKGFQYNGIDRKNNSIGYTIKNCVPCCKVCNRIKMNLDEKIFLKQIERIYENKIKKR